MDCRYIMHHFRLYWTWFAIFILNIFGDIHFNTILLLKAFISCFLSFTKKTVRFVCCCFQIIKMEFSFWHWQQNRLVIAAKFFWYLLFMFLTFSYFTFYGMMAVGLTSSQQLAAVISSAFYSIWNLFSGFLIPRPVSWLLWRFTSFPSLLAPEMWNFCNSNFCW